MSLLGQGVALMGWVGLCAAAMLLGGWATSSSVGNWYPTLIKPSFNPPSYLFGIVWPILYFLMALAAWLCWREGGFAVRAWPLGLFLAQLMVNALWSFLFFGLRSPSAGLLGILFLDVLVLATLLSFWSVRPVAGGLLVPYFAWILFATAVNAGIWYLN
ncbi:tryptophan-rich sensory protein [bacterium]|nr:tryptophan-rich sensory protein [bacterium]